MSFSDDVPAVTKVIHEANILSGCSVKDLQSDTTRLLQAGEGISVWSRDLEQAVLLSWGKMQLVARTFSNKVKFDILTLIQMGEVPSYKGPKVQ